MNPNCTKTHQVNQGESVAFLQPADNSRTEKISERDLGTSKSVTFIKKHLIYYDQI